MKPNPGGIRFAKASCLLAALLLLSLGDTLAANKDLATHYFPVPAPSLYVPLPRHDVLIINATLLDGVGGQIDNGSILLRDGKIIDVGRDIAPAGDVEIIDARARWVTPGIVDIHSHNGTFSLPLTSSDDFASDVSEESAPNVAETWIEHAINVQDLTFTRALAGGVTTLQVVPGSSPFIAGRSVILKPVPAPVVQMMKFPDARQGLKMACGENPKKHFGAKDKAPTSRQGIIAGMRIAFIQAQEYLARWQSYAKKPSRKPKPDRDLAMETLAGVLTGDILVHLHCYRADDIGVMLGLAREFNFRIAAVHHATEAYKIAGMLRDEGTCAAVWADWWGFKTEASDAIRSGAAILEQAGACTILHSDSPVVGQRLNIEAAKAMGAGARAGITIPPARAIRWITSNPAKAMGLGDRIGQLAPGYNADVVIWSGNPFSIYTRADQVFMDGARVYDRMNPARHPRTDFEVGQPNTGARP